MPRGIPNNGLPNPGCFKAGTSMPKTAEHRQAISHALKLAWQTKRKRLPVGSRIVDRFGYVRVKVHAGSGRWALDHHLVAEKMLGRKLYVGEVVHHINGDRQDNRPENLFVCRDRSHHNDVHRSQDVALRQLLHAGMVRFVEGEYEAILPRR